MLASAAAAAPGRPNPPDRPIGQSEEEEELVSGFDGGGVDDAGAPSPLGAAAVVPVGFVLEELDRESVE